MSDSYCTSVNTTWRTSSLIQDFMEHAEPTMTFLLDTNITQLLINCKTQPTSSFKFSPVQCKLALTASTFLRYEIIEALKK
jgi:hypothetical protein